MLLNVIYNWIVNIYIYVLLKVNVNTNYNKANIKEFYHLKYAPNNGNVCVPKCYRSSFLLIIEAIYR